MINKLDWSYMMKRKYEEETGLDWYDNDKNGYIVWLEQQVNLLMNGE
jgi:hypothetical protein